MNDDQGETGTADEIPRPEPSEGGESPETIRRRVADALDRLANAQDGPLFFVRELVVSVGAVVAIGLLLFAISGIWPPMVAVESGSMEPHMYRGDLVFVTDPDRFSPNYAVEDTGIVPVDVGVENGYSSFGGAGSVAVFDPPSRTGSPIIHRVHFHVEEGENWYERADPDHVSAENCAQLRYCPAPHDGFITKGDANPQYDQASGLAEPVRTEWIQGVARLRVPYLGYVRLELAGAFLPTPVAADAERDRPETVIDDGAATRSDAENRVFDTVGDVSTAQRRLGA